MLSIKVSPLVLLLDHEEQREGEEDTRGQHVVQPLCTNLVVGVVNYFFILNTNVLTLGIWKIRKNATASMLNHRVSQVPKEMKGINVECTYSALSYGITQLHSKFKGNGSTGTGEADAKH